MVKAKLLLEAVKLNPSALIDLFKLDLRPVGAVPTPDGQFNGCFYFHAGVSPWRTDVIFTDPETGGNHVYAQWPVEAKNFEWTTTSTQPRPTISFSNILGPFTQLNLQYYGLINAKVSRIRTFGRFLYGMPEADPTCYFPVETWNINRKIQEDKEICVYELANPMDVEGLALPRRIVLADQCRWLYRGDGCGYTRLGLYDINDEPVFPDIWPWRGRWVRLDPALGSYYVNEVVSWQNAYYRNIAKCSVEPPSVAVFWTPLVRNFRGDWQPNVAYTYGDVVVGEYSRANTTQLIPQYYVCNYPNTGAPLPGLGRSDYWKPDQCSLTVRGCGQRFGGSEAFPGGIDPRASTQYGGQLPFGGFPGVQLNPLQTGVGQ